MPQSNCGNPCLMGKMKIILASASPRRKEILSEIVRDFEIVPSGADESGIIAQTPAETARLLATVKAESVFALHNDAIVLGADTVVAFNGEILGKPTDAEDAFRTLSRLSGKDHEVYTGWCILGKGIRKSGFVKTKVWFNVLDESFIRSYIQSGRAFDKAGSYGIQDDERFAAKIDGSLTNVIGLPSEEIEKQFRSLGIIK